MRQTFSANSRCLKAPGSACTARPGKAFAGVAAAVVVALAMLGVLPVHAAGLPGVSLAADDAGRLNDPEQDSPGSPGTARRGPGAEEPSEDGTEAAPDAGGGGDEDAAPNRPPGCNFHGGPLELFV